MTRQDRYNLIFLVIAAILVVRFLWTGGAAILRVLNMPSHDVDHDLQGAEAHQYRV